MAALKDIGNKQKVIAQTVYMQHLGKTNKLRACNILLVGVPEEWLSWVLSCIQITIF